MELKDLKEEMPFKWRVQTANSYGANCVAFVDARDVQDKLDEVCSPEHWQVKYGLVNGNLFASLGIYSESLKEWVWKSDCGTESSEAKEKGEASDAFKRAAVMWGVGRFLYSKTIVKLGTKERKNAKGNMVWTPYIDSKFIFNAEEITKLCNDISKGKQSAKVKAVVTPAKKEPVTIKPPPRSAVLETEVKPNMTEAIFDKLMLSPKDKIEAGLKAYTMSENSELELNKVLKAYG